jgi:hypothetical protein
MPLNEDTKEVLDQVATPDAELTITIHEYFLTLDQKPTLCALSISIGDIDQPLPLRCKTSEAAHENVQAILSQYPVNAKVFINEHYRRQPN